MATLKEEDISIMIKYLSFGDDYDEAMKHFLSIASGEGLMEQSDPLPQGMKDQIQQVYSMAANKINAMFQLDKKSLLKSMQFYYIKKYNFVHGMFISGTIYGATIYFPNLEKGAFAILRRNDPETHFIRITAFRQSGGEA